MIFFAVSSRKLVFGLTILPLVTTAHAADIDATSKIEQVIVYPDAASVTRVADVELPAGHSTLTFRNLPLAIDPASIRVEGAGSVAVAIGSVEARLSSAPGLPETPR